MAGLEGGSVIEPARLTVDGLHDGLAAMARIAAPKPRHGIEQLAPVGGVVVHALGAIDEPRTPLEGAIGSEGKPIGGKLGGVERSGRWSVLRRHGVGRFRAKDVCGAGSSRICCDLFAATLLLATVQKSLCLSIALLR